jgi:hypothetical protein
MEGVLLTVVLWPATVNVMPDPRMTVKYFWEKWVYGADPFNNLIGQPVPFYVGMNYEERKN